MPTVSSEYLPLIVISLTLVFPLIIHPKPEKHGESFWVYYSQ